MALDFRLAKARALANLRGILRKHLPKGQEKGDWYVACVPWREDRTPSLGVSLTTGAYVDFGREGDKGDILSLLSKLERRPLVDIVRDLTRS